MYNKKKSEHTNYVYILLYVKQIIAINNKIRP